jgi:hypothetical protein
MPREKRSSSRVRDLRCVVVGALVLALSGGSGCRPGKVTPPPATAPSAPDRDAADHADAYAGHERLGAALYDAEFSRCP